MIIDETIQIFFGDLKEDVQKELFNIWKDNGNYDIIPLIELPIDTEEEI